MPSALFGGTAAGRSALSTEMKLLIATNHLPQGVATASVAGGLALLRQQQQMPKLVETRRFDRFSTVECPTITLAAPPARSSATNKTGR